MIFLIFNTYIFYSFFNKKYTDCPKFESVSMNFCKYCRICENDDLAIFFVHCGKKNRKSEL